MFYLTKIIGKYGQNSFSAVEQSILGQAPSRFKKSESYRTATDCLSNITPMGDGLALVGTTFFHLPQGTLITKGNTMVQPALHPTVTPSGQPVTHIMMEMELLVVQGVRIALGQ